MQHPGTRSSVHCGEGCHTFLNSACPDGLKVAQLPHTLQLHLRTGRGPLARAGRKRRALQNEVMTTLFRNLEGGEACFHILPNFLIQAVPFGEPRADGNLQSFVCQQPPVPSPLRPLPPPYGMPSHGDSRTLETGLSWDFSNS